MSCSRWAENRRVMGAPFNGPYSFKYHPWCRGIHDSKAVWTIAMKAAQLGVTETGINRAFYTLDQSKRDVLYVLPTTVNASDFSKARFATALKLSDYLKGLFVDTNTVGLKSTGTNVLYIRGSRGDSNLKSIPVSELVLLYKYDIEDILSWTCSNPEAPSEFQVVLLRDTVMQYDQASFLPTLSVERYRRLWINENGRVSLQFYNLNGEQVDQFGGPAGPVELELTRIPFTMLDIGGSLIKDVCQQQIALLNLGSSDVNYALRAKFPFYVEQNDLKAVGGHLKVMASADGTATSGGQGAADTDIKVGATHGRAYDAKMNQPAFINPSAEPLRASLELQERLKRDIRELVNLAVSALAVRASAESKQMDNQGLEAGLSYIGLVLESAERQIAEHWAAYEERTPRKRQVATVKYPDRYSLKTDSDRIKEAQDLTKLMNSVPGRRVKRELSKGVVQALLGGKVRRRK